MSNQHIIMTLRVGDVSVDVTLRRKWLKNGLAGEEQIRGSSQDVELPADLEEAKDILVGRIVEDIKREVGDVLHAAVKSLVRKLEAQGVNP